MDTVDDNDGKTELVRNEKYYTTYMVMDVDHQFWTDDSGL